MFEPKKIIDQANYHCILFILTFGTLRLQISVTGKQNEQNGFLKGMKQMFGNTREKNRINVENCLREMNYFSNQFVFYPFAPITFYLFDEFLILQF